MLIVSGSLKVNYLNFHRTLRAFSPEYLMNFLSDATMVRELIP